MVIPRVPVLKVKTRDFSRDPAAVAALDGDPLIAGEVQPVSTLRLWPEVATRFGRSFTDYPAALDSSRRRSSRQAVRSFSNAPDDGHFHDLLQDIGRDQVMSDILDWGDNHLPTLASAPAASAQA